MTLASLAAGAFALMALLDLLQSRGSAPPSVAAQLDAAWDELAIDIGGRIERDRDEAIGEMALQLTREGAEILDRERAQ